MQAYSEGELLGHIARDRAHANNERVFLKADNPKRARILRNQFVTIRDWVQPNVVFLGRILGGPFFPDPEEGQGQILAEIEIQGELHGMQGFDTNNRPATGSPVHEIPAEMVRMMLGLFGDMV